MHPLIQAIVALLRSRWRAARADDRGASAIEWAIGAIVALTIAAAVGAAITAAVNNRLPFIK